MKRAKSIIYPVRDKENMFGYFLGVVKKYYLLYDLDLADGSLTG